MKLQSFNKKLGAGKMPAQRVKMNYVAISATRELGNGVPGSSETEVPALEDTAELITEAELIVQEARHAALPLISLMNAVRLHRDEVESMERELASTRIKDQDRAGYEFQAGIHREQLNMFGAKLAVYGFEADDIRGSLRYAG